MKRRIDVLTRFDGRAAHQLLTWGGRRRLSGGPPAVKGEAGAGIPLPRNRKFLPSTPLTAPGL